MQKRLYVVTNRETGDRQLVRAATKQQARSAATRETFGVALAAQQTIFELAAAGKAIIEATGNDTEGEGEGSSS